MDFIKQKENYKNLKKGQKVEIHSYKHNEKIHRVWRYGYVVDIQDNYLVVVNERTRVFESNGRSWYTKEPAVCFFFKDNWFNVISMIRSTGVLHYCNIASPFIWDNEAIKYIDYDLDLKIFPSQRLKVLDEKEFELHSNLMSYPNNLKLLLKDELDYLKGIANNNDIFSQDNVYRYYEEYKEMTKHFNRVLLD